MSFYASANTGTEMSFMCHWCHVMLMAMTLHDKKVMLHLILIILTYECNDAIDDTISIT